MTTFLSGATGDGADVIEGGAGSDTLAFNGSGAARQTWRDRRRSARANHPRLGGVTLDVNDVELANIAPGAGSTS